MSQCDIFHFFIKALLNLTPMRCQKLIRLQVRTIILPFSVSFYLRYETQNPLHLINETLEKGMCAYLDNWACFPHPKINAFSSNDDNYCFPNLAS